MYFGANIEQKDIICKVFFAHYPTKTVRFETEKDFDGVTFYASFDLSEPDKERFQTFFDEYTELINGFDLKNETS